MSETSVLTAIVLIAHGSRREAANEDLFELVGRIKSGAQGLIVEPAFLEFAEPGIDDSARSCVEQGAHQVLLVPYFLSMGIHLTRDLADACSRLAIAYPTVHFRLGSSLGPHPLLDQLVKLRIGEIYATPVANSSAIDRPVVRD
jgi:sirohydrochlorin ferrochelatase